MRSRSCRSRRRTFSFSHDGIPRAKAMRSRTVVLVLAMMPALVHPVAAQDSVKVAPPTVLGGALTLTRRASPWFPASRWESRRRPRHLDRARRTELRAAVPHGSHGKPWAFLFWGRYRLLDRGPLHVTIGAHPALSFRSSSVTIGGVERDVIVARRYLAGELFAAYTLSRHIAVGPYYLASHAFENDVARTTQFLAARAYVTRSP